MLQSAVQRAWRTAGPLHRGLGATRGRLRCRAMPGCFVAATTAAAAGTGSAGSNMTASCQLQAVVQQRQQQRQVRRVTACGLQVCLLLGSRLLPGRRSSWACQPTHSRCRQRDQQGLSCLLAQRAQQQVQRLCLCGGRHWARFGCSCCLSLRQAQWGRCCGWGRCCQAGWGSAATAGFTELSLGFWCRELLRPLARMLQSRGTPTLRSHK